MDAKECFVSAEEIFVAKKLINIHQNFVSICSPSWAHSMDTDVEDSAD